MNESLCLTSAEIKEMTGKHWRKAQSAELNRMGFTHKIRADGSIMLLRADLEIKEKQRKKGPDYGALTSVA